MTASITSWQTARGVEPRAAWMRAEDRRRSGRPASASSWRRARGLPMARARARRAPAPRRSARPRSPRSRAPGRCRCPSCRRRRRRRCMAEAEGPVAGSSPRPRSQDLSTESATALPPPRHSVARPFFSPRCSSAWISVVSTRAPEAPIGWPSATAPPLTFTRAQSQPSALSASACAAKASLISIRSKSPIASPLLHAASRPRRSARTSGPSARCRRRVGDDARERLGPCCFTRSALVSDQRRAAVVEDGALPAVTLPSLSGDRGRASRSLGRRVGRGSPRPW